MSYKQSCIGGPISLSLGLLLGTLRVGPLGLLRLLLGTLRVLFGPFGLLLGTLRMLLGLLGPLLGTLRMLLPLEKGLGYGYRGV